jgi:hypothetical protein
MELSGTIEEQREDGRSTLREWVAVGLGSGLLGGIALTVPVVLWDWSRAGHRAFELAMAPTAWLFGLQHFSNDRYLSWPFVIGVALLIGYSALSGLVFTGLADRVFGIRGPIASIAGGLAWAFVSFIFFWDMLLPIARDGAPFRTGTISVAAGFVAPNWVWILGFTLFGLVTGAGYWALHTSPARGEVTGDRRTTRSPLQHAA